MTTRKLNKKKLMLFILAVMCAFSSLGFGIYSFAKYATNNSEKALIIPASFQFSSNYLKENNPSYNIYNFNEEITIELYNSVNTNKSEIDIPYTVTVTNGTITDGTSNGIITTSENTDTISITPTNTNNPIIVSVSSNIYEYTLSATFNYLNTGNNPYYSFINNNEYYELNIYTSSENINALTINWDSDYVPDNNNPLMENWTGTTGILSLNNNSKYTFIFFKNTDTAYSNITNTIIQNNMITLP